MEKIISKSKLKYIIEPRLRLYMDFTIESISSNVFNCIVTEEQCNKLVNVDIGNYMYVEGSARFDKGCLKIYVNKMHI